MSELNEFRHEMKVPKDRIAVLIGKKGETKKEIENYTKTRINVDSDEGEVIISSDDPITLFDSKEMIKAIARGFNPDIAKLLLKHEYVYEQINLKEFVKTKNSEERVKGRVIGSEGKARRILEELTDSNISVYGKTIGIIGYPENVAAAKKAIESLLTGSPHANVYKYLEKKRRDLKMTSLI